MHPGHKDQEPIVTNDQTLASSHHHHEQQQQQPYGSNTLGTHETTLPTEHGMHNHSQEHNQHHYGRDAALGGAAAGAMYEGHKHAGHNHHNNHASQPFTEGSGAGMYSARQPGMGATDTGAGLAGGMPAGAGAGTGAGMGAAEQIALAEQTAVAEAGNNFPGTNPHPMHSALGGEGRAMPGLE
jgi:hypothetical protein